MVIPARKRVGSTAAKEKIKKLRVAAYCRVSTETEEQNSSYEVQVAHYTEFIKKNNEWKISSRQLTLINQLISPHSTSGKQ